jgi:UDP:flavonoid glycosyltransferase YjiC (YdhE family)
LEGISEAAEELCRHAGVTGDLEELLGGIYLDICPPSLAMGGDNPFAEVIPLRPVVPAAGGGPGLELGDLPYERTVHVTLGTVVNSTAGLLETIVSGARALEVNVVVTVGPDRDPAGLGPQPRSVIVERYLPYSLLLPRCDAVISHAGAGTLLASLDNGLPSVLVPVGPEQVLNAIAATRAGVASLLVPGGLTEETVRGELGRVLGAAGFTERARAVQAEISAMPLPEQVLERLPVNRP